MTELGYGYLKRKAIGAMGYGVGKLTEETSQRGDTDIVITSKSPMGTIRNEFRIDGTQQDATDPDGGTVDVTPSWEGSKLCLQGWHRQPRTPLPTQHRSM